MGRISNFSPIVCFFRCLRELRRFGFSISDLILALKNPFNKFEIENQNSEIKIFCPQNCTN